MLALVLAQAGAAQAATSGTPAPFMLDDLFEIDRVAGAAISPDGGQVAVVTERWTRESYGGRAGTLWLVPTAGGPPRRAVEDAAEESQTRPVWSPDGRRLLYAARRGKETQLRLLDLAGGGGARAAPVCAEGENVGAVAWSPDGGRIAAICNVPPKPPKGDEDDGNEERKNGAAKAPAAPGDLGKVLVASQAPFYSGATAEPFRVERRVVIHDLADGTHREIAHGGLFLDGDGALIWRAPQTLWIVATPPHDFGGWEFADGRVIHRYDLAEERLSALPNVLHGARMPLLSPEGKGGFIVPLNGSVAGPADDWRRTWRLLPLRMRHVDAQGGVQATSDELETFLTRDSQALWSPAPDGAPGGTVYFGWLDRGSVRVKAYRPGPGGAAGSGDGWTFSDLTPAGLNVDAFSVTADGATMALVQGDASTPADVYLLDLRRPESPPRRLTRFGDAVHDVYAVSQVERVQWRSADDRFDVDGWLLKPAGYEPGKRYPLILDVHGGPGVAFRNRFDAFRFEGAHQVPPELYAARGYLVLMANPRGDPGYGREYQESLLEGWEYPTRYDLFSGVDEMVRRGYADPERLGIAGASYGGWVTTFAVSQTDRFKAASAHDPVVDTGISSAVAYRGSLASNYWLHAGFAGGHLRDVPFVSVDPRPVKTPILLRFGLKEQPPFPSMFFVSGLEYFTYLHSHCRPVEMILHPEEGHGIFDWDTLRDYIGRDLAWFDHWLLGKGDPPIRPGDCSE